MGRLRKMLGDINSPECTEIMRLMETQSRYTLEKWTLDYAKELYFPIYEKYCPGDLRLRSLLDKCVKYVGVNAERQNIKPLIKEAKTVAGETVDCIAQASARAVSTACSVVLTPTSALGFFYGTAAVVYDSAGPDKNRSQYDALAAGELRKALDSLRKNSVSGELNPAKLKWNC